MRKQLAQVREFHKKFGSPVFEEPQLIDLKRALFRIQIMQEELTEIMKGVEKGDLENITKELGDLLYTVFGTIHEYGLSHIIEEVFDRIHSSNMSKEASLNGGKAVKGLSYVEAILSDIIK